MADFQKKLVFTGDETQYTDAFTFETGDGNSGQLIVDVDEFTSGNAQATLEVTFDGGTSWADLVDYDTTHVGPSALAGVGQETASVSTVYPRMRVRVDGTGTAVMEVYVRFVMLNVAGSGGGGGGAATSVAITNTPDVTPQVGGADVSTTNPMPTEADLRVAGADVDATNPVQVEIIDGGSAVDDTNPLPVENIIAGAAVDSGNRLPVILPNYSVGVGYTDFWDEATDTFESTDSPATYDLATDLGMNAKKLAFVNRGAGAIQIELDWNNAGYTTTYYIEPNGGTWAQDGLDISDVRVTHNGTDTSYQFTAFA